MPGTEKQERFMQAIAHGWKPTQEEGPSKAVANKWLADAKAARRKAKAKKIVKGG